MNPREVLKPESSSQTTLESWKEIAAYLQRQVRTVRRWEQEEGLPIHRHSHRSRSSVYAYPSEIDAWRMSRRLVAEAPPIPSPLWRRFLTPSFAAAILLCLAMVGNGIRPASAKQSSSARSARQVWVTRPSDQPLDISPDGRYFALVDWRTGDVAIRDMKTGVDRRLTSHTGGAEAEQGVFSPDGRQIAYTWQQWTGQPYEAVMMVPASGGTPRTVWSNKGGDDWLDPLGWTPDGKQLLVKQDGYAFLSVQDGSIHPIKRPSAGSPRDPALSPDGRWIAFDALAGENQQKRDIFVLATDGSGEAAIVRNPANDVQPVWTRDGSRVLFQSDRGGRQQLWSVDFANGKAGKEELVSDIPNGRVLFWATRAGSLYYEVPGLGGPNIYTAEIGADGKISQAPVRAIDTFVNANSAPAVSPDGRILAYFSRRPGGGVVVLRDLASQNEHTIAATNGVWFSDGKSLLTFSATPQRNTAFARIDIVTGKSELPFEVQGRVQGAGISPDGKAVYYSQPHRLARRDLETQQETDLQTGAPAVDSFYSVAVSPDGKQLAYLMWPGDTDSEIHIMPTEGGASRVVFRGPGPRYAALAWAPDEKALFVVADAGNAVEGADNHTTLWRVPLNGGTPEQTIVSMPGISSPAVTPDGRRLFFAANDAAPNEVWELENYLPKPGNK